MLEFVLSYQGTLSTTGHTRAKFALMRYFNTQLTNLQNYLIEDQAPAECMFRSENRRMVGEFTFLPLVTNASRQVIDLDILFLSESDASCKANFPTGDLDNYTKTLLDGLRMAQNLNETRDLAPIENEGVIHVLMEDDQLVRNLKITHHKNLFPRFGNSKMKS